MIWEIIGHRGTGKTTLGREAAQILGIPFIDLDDLIEETTGRSPASWLAESESKFRALEVETLQNIDGPAVVAPGGGVQRIPD